MARVDSLLSILAQQGANELRLGTDREPKMLAFGTPKRLSIPVTPESTLRELMGDILTSDREKQMRASGRVDASYDAPGIGPFLVKLTARPGGFDVVFLRETPRRVQGPPPEAPATAPSAGPMSPPTPAVPFAPRPSIPPDDDAPSPMLQRLLAAAFALRASDLHLADGQVPLVRVDGALRRMSEGPLDLPPVLPPGMVRTSSGDLGLDVAGVGRARLHVFRTSEGLAASLRLLPANAPALSALHLPVPLDDLVDLPHGLVLVCGATGSGKSTTLAALGQDALRRRSIILTTLEDPIEHLLVAGEASVVRRRQIGRDVADFATGLRDALREDPDVLLLGEMRDPETIGLALTAAETGHLVLSSLHSGSAASAIERIIDAYPPERQAQIRIQLADALRAVVVQRLLPRARGTGRIPALEVLRVTHAVASLVREGRTAQFATTMQSGRREGMISLERCLADRVQAGDVRIEDARAAANDPASLGMYLGRADGK